MFKKPLAHLLFFGLLTATLLVWSLIIFSTATQGAALYFLNIGQGDSELVILPNNIKLLIDGGPSGAALLNNLNEVLSPEDRYIDLMLMTHPQLDHFGGFIDVLRNYSVGAFLGNGRAAAIGAYQALHDSLVQEQVPYVVLGEGDVIQAGEARLKIISPNPRELLSKELNDTGLVALLETPEYVALYTADIGAKIEARLVRDYDLKADILKAGHHGSKFSSSEAFVKEVNPDISVIEVGKNSYGHPTKQALTTLAAFAEQVLRTDKTGIIKIISENGKLVISHLQ